LNFEGVKWWWDSDSSRYIWFHICGAAEEKARPKVGFCPGNTQRDWNEVNDWIGGKLYEVREISCCWAA